MPLLLSKIIEIKSCFERLLIYMYHVLFPKERCGLKILFQVSPEKVTDSITCKILAVTLFFYSVATTLQGTGQHRVLLPIEYRGRQITP